MAIKVANNQSMTGITALPSAISGGAWTLLSTSTASSSSEIIITSGIDSTYDAYCFKFYNIHPATDSAHFQVNFRDGGSSYDATKTTTAFIAYHQENDGDQNFYYLTGLDLAQSTGVKKITGTIGNLNDEGSNGELYLFSPASTTYSKHFMVRTISYSQDNTPVDMYFAGYCNVTAAIDGVRFTMSSGNIDAGVVKLYGIS